MHKVRGGGLTVRNAATVVCLRRRKMPSAPVQRMSQRSRNRLASAFGAGPGLAEFEWIEGWEVLLGQNEVVNWLKSSADRIALMRYPGEYKIPGGVQDNNDSGPEETARRELEEELLRPSGLKLPNEAKLRLFSIEQTRPIRSRSNIMYNFVALEEENGWLRTLNVDAINEGLLARREKHKRLVESGEYWKMLERERHEVSPETREFRWMPLGKAVDTLLGSLEAGNFVNEFQRTAFEKFSIQRRDPMFITAHILSSIECHSDSSSISDIKVEVDDLLRKTQWLWHGMSDAEVQAAFAARKRRESIIERIMKARTRAQTSKL